MTQPRRIRLGSLEHQVREIHARDSHYGEGAFAYYGNGTTVLVVNLRARPPICEVIGEDGTREDGEPFVYSDYFLPEELAPHA